MKNSATLKEQLAGRFRGSIQGAAIGNALGFPHAGSSRTFMRALGAEVVDGFVRHRSGYFPEGQHGASVQLLASAAEAIVESGQISASAIIEHWVPLWRENRIVERLSDVDIAMSRWLRNGVSARGCACGPGEEGSGAMLCSILVGLWDHDEPDRLLEDCEIMTGVTHEDTTVRAVSAALATIIAHNLTHHSVVLAEIIDEAAHAAGRIDQSVPSRIQEIPMLLATPERDAFEQLADSADGASDVGHSGVNNAALPIFLVALHCWLRNPKEPMAVIQSCLQTGGCIDMTAAVGGALVGSSVGEGQFPARLLSGLVEGKEITVTANMLYERQRTRSRGHEE